jgi:hypothetical protein
MIEAPSDAAVKVVPANDTAVSSEMKLGALAGPLQRQQHNPIDAIREEC